MDDILLQDLKQNKFQPQSDKDLSFSTSIKNGVQVVVLKNLSKDNVEELKVLFNFKQKLDKKTLSIIFISFLTIVLIFICFHGKFTLSFDEKINVIQSISDKFISVDKEIISETIKSIEKLNDLSKLKNDKKILKLIENVKIDKSDLLSFENKTNIFSETIDTVMALNLNPIDNTIDFINSLSENKDTLLPVIKNPSILINKKINQMKDFLVDCSKLEQKIIKSIHQIKRKRLLLNSSLKMKKELLSITDYNFIFNYESTIASLTDGDLKCDLERINNHHDFCQFRKKVLDQKDLTMDEKDASYSEFLKSITLYEGFVNEIYNSLNYILTVQILPVKLIFKFDQEYQKKYSELFNLFNERQKCMQNLIEIIFNFFTELHKFNFILPLKENLIKCFNMFVKIVSDITIKFYDYFSYTSFLLKKFENMFDVNFKTSNKIAETLSENFVYKFYSNPYSNYYCYYYQNLLSGFYASLIFKELMKEKEEIDKMSFQSFELTSDEKNQLIKYNEICSTIEIKIKNPQVNWKELSPLFSQFFFDRDSILFIYQKNIDHVLNQNVEIFDFINLQKNHNIIIQNYKRVKQLNESIFLQMVKQYEKIIKRNDFRYIIIELIGKKIPIPFYNNIQKELELFKYDELRCSEISYPRNQIEPFYILTNGTTPLTIIVNHEIKEKEINTKYLMYILIALITSLTTYGMYKLVSTYQFQKIDKLYTVKVTDKIINQTREFYIRFNPWIKDYSYKKDVKKLYTKFYRENENDLKGQEFHKRIKEILYDETLSTEEMEQIEVNLFDDLQDYDKFFLSHVIKKMKLNIFIPDDETMKTINVIKDYIIQRNFIESRKM